MPEQPDDMAEQPREASIYIFGYRGLDLPLKKDMPAPEVPSLAELLEDMPAPEVPSLAELFDRWNRETWQVVPTEKGVGIVVRTLKARNRIIRGGTGAVKTNHLHASDGDHTIHRFDPRTDQLVVYGVKNASLKKETADAVEVHLSPPDGPIITLELRGNS
jgi:hypothetical protein